MNDVVLIEFMASRDHDSFCSNQTGCKGRVTDSWAFHDTFVTKPHRAIDHGQTDGWDHMAAGEAYHVSLIVLLVCKTRQLPSD